MAVSPRFLEAPCGASAGAWERMVSGIAVPDKGARTRASRERRRAMLRWPPEGPNMTILADIVLALVALLHVYFLVLEMFLWTKPLGLKTFRQSPEKAADSAVLAANQGLYNGFLAAGLVWSLIEPDPAAAARIATFFLICIVIAGLYGGYSVSRRIVFVQALPAAIALVLVWLS
jgi:putative membrane protein